MSLFFFWGFSSRGIVLSVFHFHSEFTVALRIPTLVATRQNPSSPSRPDATRLPKMQRLVSKSLPAPRTLGKYGPVRPSSIRNHSEGYRGAFWFISMPKEMSLWFNSPFRSAQVKGPLWLRAALTAIPGLPYPKPIPFSRRDHQGVGDQAPLSNRTHLPRNRSK